MQKFEYKHPQHCQSRVINPWKTTINLKYLNIQLVSCSKHSVPTVETTRLMLYGEIIRAFSKAHAEHMHIYNFCAECTIFKRVHKNKKSDY